MATFVWTVITTTAITMKEVLGPVKMMILVVGRLLIGVGLYVVFAKQKGRIEPALSSYRFEVRTRRLTVIFLVIATFITTLITALWQKQELAQLKIGKLEHSQATVFQYTRIELERKALVSSLEALAGAYKKLSEDFRLTKAERDRYKKLYEDVYAELEKQIILTKTAIARRIQAEVALEELKKQFGADTELTKQELLIDSLTVKLAKTEAALEGLKKRFIPDKVSLRSSARTNLLEKDVKKMLSRKNFYDYQWNPNGKGIKNEYQPKTINDDVVVIDHTTGLMWQQLGSVMTMTYERAQAYILILNRDRFAGYGDWKLPTLEETMSLMEPEPATEGKSHIYPVFRLDQTHIWTIDKVSILLADEVSGYEKMTETAWVVNFYNGGCYIDLGLSLIVVNSKKMILNLHDRDPAEVVRTREHYVRAVRLAVVDE